MTAFVPADMTGARHVELFYSLTTNEPIQVWCDCPIGSLHTYDEWVDRFQHYKPSEAGRER